MTEKRKYRQPPAREIRCQICPWQAKRYFGSGILVKPCPKCGSRVTFAQPWQGDMPVTPDEKLSAKAA